MRTFPICCMWQNHRKRPAGSLCAATRRRFCHQSWRGRWQRLVRHTEDTCSPEWTHRLQLSQTALQCSPLKYSTKNVMQCFIYLDNINTYILYTLHYCIKTFYFFIFYFSNNRNNSMQYLRILCLIQCVAIFSIFNPFVLVATFRNRKKILFFVFLVHLSH